MAVETPEMSDGTPTDDLIAAQAPDHPSDLGRSLRTRRSSSDALGRGYCEADAGFHWLAGMARTLAELAGSMVSEVQPMEVAP